MYDGVKSFAYIIWFEFDLDAALPAIHEHSSLARDGRVKNDGHTLLLPEGTDPPPTWQPVNRSASAGRIMLAALPRNAAASFFMLTARSEGTMTQTGLPSTSAISVLQEAPRLDADGFRSLDTGAFCSRIVIVMMDGEIHTELGQHKGSARAP